MICTHEIEGEEECTKCRSIDLKQEDQNKVKPQDMTEINDHNSGSIEEKDHISKEANTQSKNRISSTSIKEKKVEGHKNSPNNNAPIAKMEDDSEDKNKIDADPVDAHQENEGNKKEQPEPESETKNQSEKSIENNNPSIVIREKSRGGQVAVTSGGAPIVQISCEIGRKEFNGNSRNNEVEEGLTIYDLTEELPPKEFVVASEFEVDEIDDYLKKLNEEWVILISCLDDDIASSAAYALMHRLDIAENNKRYYDFEKIGLNGKEVLIDRLLNSIISSNEECAIVVDATNGTASFFLDSLLGRTSFGSGKIKHKLKNSKSFIVCLVDQRHPKFNSDEKSVNFTHWNIDFLFPILKQKIPQRAQELLKEIPKQRKLGLWGNSDEEFYNHISGYLRLNKLCDEFDKRKNRNSSKGDKSFLAELQPIQAGKLISEGGQVENTVLFVGAFFSRLSPSDFERLVSLLLGNKKTNREITSKRLSDEGKTLYEITTEEVKLIEIWGEQSDIILEKCCLHALSIGDSTRVIDFYHPYLRKDLKDYFQNKRSLYLETQFRSIQSLGLLFDRSTIVTENVIQFAIQMAASNPNQHGKEWLITLVLGLTKRFDISIEKVTTSRDPLIELLHAIVEDEKIKEITLARISQLIRQILNHPNLISTIDAFLEHLLVGQLHYLVIDVIHHLQFSPKFKLFFWIKQLFDRGKEGVRLKTYALLCGLSTNNDTNIYEFLYTLSRWLPEIEKEEAKYSYSNRYALVFLLDYSRKTGSNYHNSDFGVWPSPYSLFCEIDTKAEKSFQIISNWLFHPGMEGVVVNADKETLYADIIFKWAAILVGFNKKEAHSDANNLLEILLKSIVDASSKTQQKKMLDAWLLMTQYLLKEINSKNLTGERFERKQLIRRRNLVRETRRRFKNLCKQKTMT